MALEPKEGVMPQLKPMADVYMAFVAEEIVASENDDSFIDESCTVIHIDIAIHLDVSCVIKHCAGSCHVFMIHSDDNHAAFDRAMDVDGTNASRLDRTIDIDR